jgi:FdhD protein
MSADRPGPTTRRQVVEIVAGQPMGKHDTVVTEEPLELRLSWPGHQATRVSVTMRTPGADFELAAGYMLAEGVLAIGEKPRSVAYCVDRTLSEEQRYNVVTVELDAPPRRHPSVRTTTMTSACGVCGTESLDEVFAVDSTPVRVEGTIAPAVVSALPDLLRERQPLFGKTGSIHASGVFGFDGELIIVREDIGRHNTVDKVVGARQLGSVDYGEESALCVSGRIGFDIATKAVSARIAVVVGVGGPSSLAIELADRAGITLCGFARGNRFVAYTHPERIGGR